MRWLREQAGRLRRQVITLWFAVRDPRTPLAARLIAGMVVAYALSPVDLIPDFVPVLGYLDDLVLVPLGIALALRMIPPQVLAEAHERAVAYTGRPTSRVAGMVIVSIWIAAAFGLGWLAWRMWSGPAA